MDDWEGKIHLGKLPAIRFTYHDSRETQRPDELPATPQFIKCIRPTAQNGKQFLFRAEV
jgi:hypothetical protein